MWLTSMSAMGDVVGDVAVHGHKDTRGFGSNRQFHHDPNSIVSPIATSKTFIIYHSAGSRRARFTAAGPASTPFWRTAAANSVRADRAMMFYPGQPDVCE